VVTPRTVVPPGSLVLGAPAKVVRQLSDNEQAGLRHWAEKYLDVSLAHAAHEKSKHPV
jgi:carbonic anhydrase/acetyltransferase-like protein (isoleucine patch superfamily)